MESFPKRRDFTLDSSFRFSLGPGFEGMTYFSVIRDPVSRTVSHFNYLRHHPQYAKEWFKTKRDEQMVRELRSF